MKALKKSKKAAILATILSGCLWASPVLAGNLVVGIPSDYGNSQMGAVTGSFVTTKVDATPTAGIITDLNRDPACFPILYKGKSMFVLRQYTYSTTNLKNQYLLDSNGTWSLESSASGIVNSVANTHAAASYGDYVFMTGYDLGNIAVCTVGDALIEDTSKKVNLLQDIIDHCGGDYTVVTEGTSEELARNPVAHGEGLLCKDGYLYACVSINPQGGYDPYDEGYLIQYKIGDDGSLTYVNHSRVGKNTDVVRMNLYNNMIMTAAIGGYQHYGVDEGNVEDTCLTVNFINGSTLESDAHKVVVPEKVKEKGLDFRDLKVLPNGTAYVMTYNLNGSGGGSYMMAYKTTVANLLSDNPIDWEVIWDDNVQGGEDGAASGWFNKLNAEYYTKRVWMEIGDSLAVYEDGDTDPTHWWKTNEFSTDKQLYMWNSVNLLKPDETYGERALLISNQEEGLTTPSQTTATIINANATNKKGDYQYSITGTEKDDVYTAVTSDYAKYSFDKDICINLGLAREGDLTNNILAAVYAHDGNNLTIDSGDNELQLQVKNVIATPVGVYAGNGLGVTINAGKLNIITAGLEGGNTLTNAIMNDGGLNKASSITINADVNINMTGGYGGNGIAVQKTDRWGEASYASNVKNSIVINGNVAIKGADNATWGIPINAENVFSRFNNAGILTQVENSEVTVNGLVDFDVYGNGITTNAAGSKVTIGGGHITVPKGMDYSYYALGAYQGSINVNTGTDGLTVGTNDVQLDGDVFALNTGTINLALNTGDSYLNGIIDNGGTVNLWLGNGATWKNEQNNERYYLDDEDVGSNGISHVTKLTGGKSGSEGVIYQTKNSKDLEIEQYSGKVIALYEHNTSDPTQIYGGDIHIAKAATDSAITLRTDSSGLDLSKTESLDAVLNALAQKLYYGEAINGVANLDGYVEIAEGLTAASVAKYSGTIKYDASSGQGSLDAGGTEPEEPPEKPTEQNKELFTTSITGDYNTDTEYVEGGVLTEDNATYKFIKANSSITTEDTAVSSTKALQLELNGNSLSISSSAGKGVDVSANVDFNAVKELSITGTDAVKVSGANVNIHNSGLFTANGNIVAENGAITVDGASKVTGNVSLTNSSLSMAGAEVAGDISAAKSTLTAADLTGVGAVELENGSVATLQSLSASGNVSADNSVLTVNGKAAIGGGIELINGASASMNELEVEQGAVLNGSELTVNSKATIGGNLSAENSSKVTLKEAAVDGDVVADASELKVSEKATIGGKVSAKNAASISLKNAVIEGGAETDGTSAIELSASTLKGAGEGKLSLSEGSSWTGSSTLGALNLELDASSWTGSAVGGSVSLDNTSTWEGNLTSGTVTLDNTSTWTGSAAGGSVSLANSSTWTGSGSDLALTMNNSLWQNTGLSTLTSFNGSKAVVDMTAAGAGNVTIGSYSGDATLIYSHSGSGTSFTMNGGDFTITKAAAGSSITLLTNNTGVDTTDEDSINAALNALANKLYYSTYSEGNLNGVVKIAEGLTSASVAKQTGNIVFSGDKGQGSLDTATVTPGPTYPTEQDRTEFVTSITGDYATDKEYRKAGVLTEDNATYKFIKSNSSITTDGTAVSSAKALKLELNGNSLSISSSAGKGVDVTGNVDFNAVNELSITGTDAVKVSGANVNIHNSGLFTANGNIVAENGAITVDGASKITGNVSLTNSSLSMAGAEINGNISAAKGTLTAAELTGVGAVELENGSVATLQSLSASGNVSADNSELSISEKATIGGSLELTKSASASMNELEVEQGAALNGSELIVNSKANIGGNLSAENSSKVTMKEAAVDGNVSADNSNVSISEKATIGGKVSAKNAASISLKNAVIEGGAETDESSAIELSASTLKGAGEGKLSLSEGSSWTGSSTLGALNLELDASSWTGSAVGGSVSLDNTSTWEGNLTSGTVTLDNASTWTGNSAGGSVSLANSSTWTGYGSDLALTMNNSLWQNTGLSTLTSFNGSKAVVDMTAAGAGNITIGSYSGDATLIYSHTGSGTSFTMNGGDFTITKAAAGSSITLLTNNIGVDTTDEDSINAALNALANKLYYTTYSEGNLNGVVKIAEGLTSASAAKQTGNIVFSGDKGQGSLDTATVTPGPTYPTEQDRTEFVTSITGDYATDKEYRKAGVLTEDNATYKFIKSNSSITTDGTAVSSAKALKLELNGNSLSISSSAGKGVDVSGNVDFNAVKELNITGTDAVKVSGANVNIHNSGLFTANGNIVAENGAITVDGASKVTGNVSLTNSSLSLAGAEVAGNISAAKSTLTAADLTGVGAVELENYSTATLQSLSASGNVSADNSELSISEKATIGGSLELTKSASASMNELEVEQGAALNGSELIVNSKANIGGNLSAENSSKVTLKEAAVDGNVSADNSILNVSGKATIGGKVSAKNAASISMKNAVIEGGAETDETSAIELSASTLKGAGEGKLSLSEGSSWTGSSTLGALNLQLDASSWIGSAAGGSVSLANSSTWTGYGRDLALSMNNSLWQNTGVSTLTSFSGSKAVVDMTAAGAGNVTIGSYSGDATLIYSHTGSGTSFTMNGGDFTITKAAAGSSITLMTNNTGVDTTDEDSINAALNALANKLYYTTYSEGNLSGVVKIAEGLTSASAAKQTGSIVFSGEKGQGSLDTATVTPGPTYPTEQDRTEFITSITGDYATDKEYRKAGVLTEDNGIYKFTKDLTSITTDSNTVGGTKDIQLQLNGKNIQLNSQATAVYADSSSISINAVNNLELTAKEHALQAVNGGQITINNQGILSTHGNIEAENGSKITVKGLVNIQTDTMAARTTPDAVHADNSEIYLGGGSINGNLLSENKGLIVINGEQQNDVDITGDLSALDNSEIRIYMNTAASSLTGNVKAIDSTIDLYLANNAKWDGAATGSNINLTLDNATWSNKGNSTIHNFKGSNGIVMMDDEAAGNVHIDNYAGNAKVIYSHNVSELADGKEFSINGGDFVIAKAETGSKITLITDRNGIDSLSDKENIAKLLDNLANKLCFEDAAEHADNLSANVQLAEGLTANSMTRANALINFNANGQGQLDATSLEIKNTPEVIYGDSETAMMRGAKAAMASTSMIWRAEANDLVKRMGDLRLAEGEHGVWAKYYGGKYEMDSQKSTFNTSYKAYQLGYDVELKNGWTVGAAVSYNDGNSTYSRGHGDQSVVSLGLYGTWKHADGQYVDLIVKRSKLDNEYTVYNDMDHRLDGDYSAWGTSLSAEYGKYIENKKGVFLNPSLELTMGRVEDSQYSAMSDFLDAQGMKKAMQVEQDAFTSVVGRLGLRVGQKLEQGSYYAKLALAHEFSGDYSTTFRAEGEPEGKTSIDFGDTWCELQLGGTMKLSDHSLFYASYQQSFGGEVSEKWRLDAGLRWSF